MEWIQPTPNHYWDTKSMSWKLPSNCSELIHTSGSTVDETDWNAFAKRHMESEGFDPNPRDERVKVLYKFYSYGAHDEHLGKLGK